MEVTPSAPDERGLPPVRRGGTNKDVPRSDLKRINSLHNHTGKTKIRNLRHAHNVAQSGDISSSVPNTKIGRGRTNSLRRVKDSSEVLRQRSLKSSKEKDQRSLTTRTSAIREGRQFTVGNVGNNGKLYLRPVTASNRIRNQPEAFMEYSTPSRTTGDAQPISRNAVTAKLSRQSIWSNSQISELRPSGRPQGSEANASSEYDILHTAHTPEPQRRYSLASSDDELDRIDPKKGGKLKIVIERTEPQRPRSAKEHQSPSLEVHIPHYRLGGFRITDEGNPILRSSAYTRTSTSDHFRASTFSTDMPLPPPLPQDLTHGENSPSLATSLFPASRALSGIVSPPPDSAVFYKMEEPIEASVFDSLIPIMDDTSVVRYARGTHDILAATPARIVAEISSDSFMDYELVSDFFLTFRCFLSPANLLSLLLARLYWAVNRLQEDGRIIRIRVFAALRHWILNYFVDDFVTNQQLRVQFCDQVNRMYYDVKQRNKDRKSDLKILLDLKRCWNGRCLLYWDSPQFLTDGQTDVDVFPGGVVGSRDPELTRLSGASSSMSETTSQARATAFKISSIADGASDLRERKETFDQSKIGKDYMNSIPDYSSSTPPPDIPKRSSLRAKIPNPVIAELQGSTTSHPAATPSAVAELRRPFHSHKRSGSFSDSIRDDRVSLPHLNPDYQRQSLLHDLPNTSRFIRGTACAPADPSILGPCPPSPKFDSTQTTLRRTQSSGRSDYPSRLGTPGVKTILGSIRRALHNRQGGGSVSSNGSSPGSLPSVRGKTATLPANIALGTNTHRRRKIGAKSKAQPRVDVLGEAAHLRYYELHGNGSEVSGSSAQRSQRKSEENELPRLSYESGDHRPLSPDVTRLDRIPSEVTAGSKSIVIVDDTRKAEPLMSGAVKSCLAGEAGGFSRTHILSEASTEVDLMLSLDTHSVPIISAGQTHVTTSIDSDDERSAAPPLGLPQGVDDSSPWRSSYQGRRISGNAVTSVSTKLHKYASYQSGMVKYGPGSSGNGTPTGSVTGTDSSHFSPHGPLERTLKRRPGGDLRKVQNIYDLGTLLQPASFASGSTLSESHDKSILYIADNQSAGHLYVKDTANRDFITPRNHPSETCSSHRMRRSFEQAVAGLSGIPDDDDGGIESALLKLEGKWDKSPPRDPGDGQDGNSTAAERRRVEEHEKKRKIYRGQQLLGPVSATAKSQKQDSIYGNSALRTESFLESEDSYCSIPLLERGLSDDSMKSPASGRILSKGVMPHPLFHAKEIIAIDTHTMSDPSVEVILEVENQQVAADLANSQATTRTRSVVSGNGDKLGDDHASELSSEISVDIVDQDEAADAAASDEKVATSNFGFSALGVFAHPLSNQPAAPSSQQEQPRSRTAPGGVITSRSPTYPQKSTTADQSPRAETSASSRSRTIGAEQTRSAPGVAHSGKATALRLSPAERLSSTSGHLPFVLACESQVLAQQFTLVEKAALNEIDWKDLVEMRWSNSPHMALSWVDYNARDDLRGIDMVVTRFNLVVKWVLSEIVLTKDLNERAQTITKFIHVAAQARKLCNYATMLQIVIALSSSDSVGLQKTWDNVPGGEKRSFKEMQALIQPLRNFRTLRSEMETTNLHDGCIPFVGLYIQDLTYNAQKPAQIAGTREGEPLVNFERYRTAASIAKGLLRLIDASTKYDFEPIPGLIERCLWISTLSDETINLLSKGIQ